MQESKEDRIRMLNAKISDLQSQLQRLKTENLFLKESQDKLNNRTDIVSRLYLDMMTMIRHRYTETEALEFITAKLEEIKNKMDIQRGDII